jgi:hypothetical protein
MNMHLASFFYTAGTKSKLDYELIYWNVSKLPSVDILVMANIGIHAIVSTIENYENRTLTPISVSINFVQSTVSNNNSVRQTVTDLALIMSNSRITLIPYSNIQINVTIHFYGTNDKNWNSDLYWKVIFNSCDKYDELYCWLLNVIYFDE